MTLQSSVSFFAVGMAAKFSMLQYMRCTTSFATHMQLVYRGSHSQSTINIGRLFKRVLVLNGKFPFPLM